MKRLDFSAEFSVLEIEAIRSATQHLVELPSVYVVALAGIRVTRYPSAPTISEISGKTKLCRE